MMARPQVTIRIVCRFFPAVTHENNELFQMSTQAVATLLHPGQVNQRQVDESNRAWVTTSPVEIALRQICDAIHQQKPEQQGGVSILSSHCTTGVIVYVKHLHSMIIMAAKIGKTRLHNHM